MASATEKAVAQLKAYGKYIYDHAENTGWAIDYDGESLFRDCEEIVRCQKPAKNEDVKPDRLGDLSGSQAYFPVEDESRLRK